MMTLHGYWRSSASYRVRIALAIKGVEVKHVSVNLKEGAQLEAPHSELNAQPFVPVLELEDGTKLTQSLAIMDYIDATFREPDLMPRDALLRSRVLSASFIIASDIAPIQNSSVQKYIAAEYDQDRDGVKDWAAHWIAKGFTALEKTAQAHYEIYKTDFLIGDAPRFFECCLIPQIYNANRFGVDMSAFPRLSEINKNCLALPEFQKALPENQADAV